MPQQLYTVTVKVPLLVVADGEKEAMKLGERYAGEQIARGWAVIRALLTTYMTEGWEDCLPYIDPRFEADKRTCEQWLEDAQ